MKRRTVRSCVALMLVLCIFIGLCPITALADGPEPLVLVSLGDSMTNGFGMPGFDEEGKGVEGFRQTDVEGTYPARLAAYLAEQNKVDVDWRQLAMNCMRVEDINFALRFDTESDAMIALANELKYKDNSSDAWNDGIKEKWNTTFVDDGHVIGDYYTFCNYVSDRFNQWGVVYEDDGVNGYPWRTNGTKAYARYFQNSVANADVITVAAGGATFGVVLLQNLIGALGEELKMNPIGALGEELKIADLFPYNDVDDIVGFVGDRVPDFLAPYAKELVNKINDKVGDLLIEAGLPKTELYDRVLRMLEYTCLSYIVNYMDMLDAIDELNTKENVDVILLSMTNPLTDVKVKVADSEIDFGEIMDICLDFLSAPALVLPVLKQQLPRQFKNVTFYVAENPEHLETLAYDYSDHTKVHDNDEMRENVIEAYNDTVYDLVGEILGEMSIPQPSASPIPVAVNKADLEDVKAYEDVMALYAKWVENDTVFTLPSVDLDMLSTSIYLPFESAFERGAGISTIDLDGLIDGLDLDELFDSMENLDLEIAPEDFLDNATYYVEKAWEEEYDAVTTAVHELESTYSLSEDGAKARYVAENVLPTFLMLEVFDAVQDGLDTVLDNDIIDILMAVLGRATINHGVTIHPNADGHKAIYDSIMVLYPNTDARTYLRAQTDKAVELLYQLSVHYGAEAMRFVKQFAVDAGWLEPSDAPDIDQLIGLIEVSLANKNYEDTLKACSDLIQKIIDLAFAGGVDNTTAVESVETALGMYSVMKGKDCDGLLGLIIAELKAIKTTKSIVRLVAVEAFLTYEGFKFAKEFKAVAETLSVIIDGYRAGLDKAMDAFVAEITALLQKEAEIVGSIADGIRESTLAALQNIIEQIKKAFEPKPTPVPTLPAPPCPKDYTCPMAAFTDLGPASWYHDGIHYCLENGLMVGTGADTFTPNGTATRAMIVSILWRMEGCPSVNYAMTFKDVPAGAWYAEAVRWAASEGVVSGYSADKFGPEDPVSREQLCSILYRYTAPSSSLYETAWKDLLGFADNAKVSKWAGASVYWAFVKGIVSGKDGNKFDPTAGATRAEVASIFQRYCEM